MAEYIDAKQAAAILDIPESCFVSFRKAIGIPEPAYGKQGKGGSQRFDESLIRKWGENNNVRQLLVEERYFRRNGCYKDGSTERRQVRTKTKLTLMERFIRGEFAPKREALEG